MFFASKYVNLDVGSDSEEEVEGDIDINDDDDDDVLPQRVEFGEPAADRVLQRGERLEEQIAPLDRNADLAAPERQEAKKGGIAGFFSSIFNSSPAEQQQQQRNSVVSAPSFGAPRDAYGPPPPVAFGGFGAPPMPPPPSRRKAARKPALVRKVKVRKLDTNVLSLELGTALDAKVPIATGDASSCRTCSAYLSAKSSTVTEEYDSGEPELQTRKVWKCEFCGTTQEVFLEDEEMPKEESVDYLLNEESSSSSSSAVASEDGKEAPQLQNDSMIVFCVDTSGSMCVTTEIDGKIKLKGFDRLERYKALNAEHEDQYMPSQRRDTTYVSRLQCVQAAVDSQLEEIQRTSPNTKICLITFNHDVTVWGDGSQEPLILSGDKLSDYDQLVKEAKAYNTVKPISESIEKLREKLFSLEDGGSTALGPALLVSLTLISKFIGSRVIVCTDGRANVGLGNLDEDADIAIADAFYKRLATEALAQGSIVSVVTIKGTDCKLEYLSPVANSTMGDIVIVDPFDLTNQFSNILAEPVIAAGVSITLLLHHGLFCRENLLSKKDKPSSPVPMVDDASASSSSSGEAPLANAVKKILRDIGNVTKDTTTTFEYGIVKAFKKELFEKHKKGEEHLSSIPFQVQIRFRRISDGMKLIRVITKSMELAFDRKVAEEEVQLDVLAQHSDNLSSVLAMEGDYSRSRAYGYASHQFMGQFAASSASNAHAFKKWKHDIIDRNDSIQQNQDLESASGLNLSDDEADEDEDQVKEKRAKKSLFRREQRSDEVFSKVSSAHKKKFK